MKIPMVSEVSGMRYLGTVVPVKNTSTSVIQYSSTVLVRS